MCYACFECQNDKSLLCERIFKCNGKRDRIHVIQNPANGEIEPKFVVVELQQQSQKIEYE